MLHSLEYRLWPSTARLPLSSTPLLSFSNTPLAHWPLFPVFHLLKDFGHYRGPSSNLVDRTEQSEKALSAPRPACIPANAGYSPHSSKYIQSATLETISLLSDATAGSSYLGVLGPMLFCSVTTYLFRIRCILFVSPYLPPSPLPYPFVLLLVLYYTCMKNCPVQGTGWVSVTAPLPVRHGHPHHLFRPR